MSLKRKTFQTALSNDATQPACPIGSGNYSAVLGVCVFLVAAIWVVFGQTLHCEFVNYDDDEQIYEHPMVKNGLSLQGVVWVFTHSDDGHWIPLNKISHMLDCQFYGLKPGGHHLTNVLLHTVSVIVLFLVLRRMTGFLWRSAFVAAVFAIHPLRVESVAWVAERKDVLSGFFFMLTLWAYVGYVRRTQIRGQQSSMRKLFYGFQPLTSVDYWFALLFFACGLMSKAMVATLPLLLLLLDYWPLHRFLRPEPVAAKDKKKLLPVFQRLIFEKIPFLVLIIAAGVGLLFSRDRNNVVVAVALQTGRGLASHSDLSLMVRTGHALLTPLVYLKQMFFPARLVVFSPPHQSVSPLEMFMAVMLLTAISVLILARRRKQPYLVTGWFWYLVMLAPVLMLIQQGAEVRCDRYTYLPQIGLYILLTWTVVELTVSWRSRRWVLGGGATVVLAVLIACARIQTAYWRDSESLWTHALACTSNNTVAHNNLGDAFYQQGRMDEAIVQFQKTLAINPNNAEANYDLGNAFFKQGRMDEAIAQFHKTLAINVNNTDVHYNNADVHNNLGNIFLRQGRMDEAVAQFQEALAINPKNADAQYNLGNAFRRQGGVNEAIAQFQKALAIKPQFAEAHYNLGNAFLQQGQVDEAIAHFQKALTIKPNYVEARNNLAWVLATCPQASLRNGIEAVKLAEQANQLTGGENPVVLCTLAAAFGEAGRFPEAIETAQRALQLAEAQSNTTLAGTLQSQLKLYQAGIPFHGAEQVP